MDDVEQYHQIANNMQIKQYLLETKLNLKHMVRTVHIKKQVLSNLALISVLILFLSNKTIFFKIGYFIFLAMFERLFKTDAR